MSRKEVNRDTQQFRNGFRIERKEHPTLSDGQVGTVVCDHLKEHPSMYLNKKKS